MRLALLTREDPAAGVRAPAASRDGQSRLQDAEPLEPREAVRVLWEAVGVPLTPEARDAAKRYVPELLRRIHFRRLRLGDAPLS